MGLITSSLLNRLNSYLSCYSGDLKVAQLNLGDITSGFKIYGIVDSPIIVNLPSWKVQEYNKGFGGWVIYNQETLGSIRFIRQKLTHKNLGSILNWVNIMAEDSNFDPRSNAITVKIVSMLPRSGFYIQDFEEQVTLALYSIITDLSAESAGRETTRRIGAIVRRKLNLFLNSFPIVMSNIDSEDKSKVLFSRDQLVIGTPEIGEAIGGIPELLRDLFVKYLHDTTSINNLWGVKFKASIGCTSKGKPGEWVTMIPESVKRKTPLGFIDSSLKMPLMIHATSVFVENPKRVLREGNAVQNAWSLVSPRPIDNDIWTGYEHHMDESTRNKMTQVFTCFAEIEGINVYTNKSGETLNLDDIILTPAGREALRTVYSKKKTFTDIQWSDIKNRLKYYKSDGSTIKEQYKIHTDMTRVTSIDSMDVYQPQVTVLETDKVCQDTIIKVMLGDTLKAMTKIIDHELYAVDAMGNQYNIECIVSGMSIKEKKVPTLPLAALAARMKLGYIEELENPINTNRKPEDNYDKYSDLVNKIGTALKDNNEDINGYMRIFARDPERRIDTYLGKAICGPLRASVLMENEHNSSKTRQDSAIPFQISIRNLANIPIELSEDIKNNIRICQDVRKNIIKHIED